MTTRVLLLVDAVSASCRRWAALGWLVAAMARKDHKC